MFGFIVADIEALTDEEKHRYKEFYCGICHALKARYGQLSRFCTTYDMAFMAMLLSAIDDLSEENTREDCGNVGAACEDCGNVRGVGTHRRGRCIVHPTKTHRYVVSDYVDYAADMSVVLVWHKCLDDRADEKRKRALSAWAYSRALRRAYRKVTKRYPEVCETAAQSLGRIAEIERALRAPKSACAASAVDEKSATRAAGAAGAAARGKAKEHVPHANAQEQEACAQDSCTSEAIALADEAGREFGHVMGAMFAGPGSGANSGSGAHAGSHSGANAGVVHGHLVRVFADDLAQFGAELGRFIYFIDAAVDREEDSEKGAFNPFEACGISREEAHELLLNLAGRTAQSFERLPIEKDIHILRSVLYSGMWQQYNGENMKNDVNGDGEDAAVREEATRASAQELRHVPAQERAAKRSAENV